MENGMRQVDVYVNGPGAGRVCHSFIAECWIAHQFDPRCHADPSQRLPPAEASACVGQIQRENIIVADLVVRTLLR